MVYINFLSPVSQASIPHPPLHFSNSNNIGIETSKLATHLPTIKKIDPPSATCEPELYDPFVKFPAEIKSMIVKELDIVALFMLRSTNKTCRAIVDSDPIYRKVIAPKTFRFLHLLDITNITFLLTAGEFVSLVATNNPVCRSCNKQGDLFDILHFERVCHSCFKRTNKPYASLARVMEVSGLSAKKIRLRATVMKTVPGARRAQHIMSMESAKALVGEKKMWLCARKTCLKQQMVVVAKSVGL